MYWNILFKIYIVGMYLIIPFIHCGEILTISGAGRNWLGKESCWFIGKQTDMISILTNAKQILIKRIRLLEMLSKIEKSLDCLPLYMFRFNHFENLNALKSEIFEILHFIYPWSCVIYCFAVDVMNKHNVIVTVLCL